MNPIIVALDLEGAAEALQLVDRIGSAVGFYKVGLELFTAEGPAVVRELTARGKQVFVDLKMYDIGATVERATARVAALGASFLTVHSSPQVIQAAIRGRGASSLKILAVTVLTSFDDGDIADLGYTGRTAASLVEHFVQKGVAAGVDGFISSPLEVAHARAIAGPGKILVSPGVRSAGTSHGDQKRVATPSEAIAAGANYLVIGREITRAPQPDVAAQRILSDLGEFARA
jgi:orotidine-5'-phosphate decarboxylase